MTERPEITRFAPSPTGFLHLGHAYAALTAWNTAHESGGRFLLRIEDIDRTRCRAEFEQAIYEDLRWLGAGLPGWGWEEPVRRQSEHMAEYAAAIESLRRDGLVYPCFCTRAQILAEVAKAGVAPHGVEGPFYPGTCRALSSDARERKIAANEPFALRLNLARATAKAGPLTWHDRRQGTIEARPEIFGDAVIARKEIPASYHLAVTLDDHLQGVTLVTRGEDLFEATHIQRLLQSLLGLNTPEYSHHPLLCDERGRRFAKRDKALTLRALRFSGVSPKDARAMAEARQSSGTAQRA